MDFDLVFPEFSGINESEFNGQYFSFGLDNHQATDNNREHEIRMMLLDPGNHNQNNDEKSSLSVSAPVAPKTHKPCPKCNKTFSLSSSLSRHKKTCGVTERDFACDYPGCEYKATTKFNLEMHKKIHGEKNFVCDLCNAGFKTPPALRNHKTTHYPPTYFCDKCGKGFKTSTSRGKHKKNCRPV
jgi:uncharacterized Zn-finger protein